MKKKICILFVFMLIIGIINLLSNATKKTYAAGTTLADTVIVLNRGSSWNAGASGVYYTNNHEYRYVGTEPNNYVSFNNDLYRIIGVFDDYSHGVTGKNLVKLIRARTLGSYSWGKYADDMTLNSNDWTGNKDILNESDNTPPANANILLNEYYYNKSNTSDIYGACSNWTYNSSDASYKSNDCSDIVGYGIDNSLQNYIEEVTWYLNGYKGNSYSKQDFYLCERGQSSDTTNCMSGNSGVYDASTTAHIGLMYVSDYMYASSYYSSSNTTTGSKASYSGNNNWLYNGEEWTMTPTAISSVFRVTRESKIGNSYDYFSAVVRPSFYLKSSVYVTGGNGSFFNPYTIACDDCGGSSGGSSDAANETLTHLQNLGFTGEVSNTNLTTFTATSESDGTTGIYVAEDDLGTSYYFRGNITNNYVKFGKNASNQDMYWRIIRINGDGSIRMIYDGTSAHVNGEISTDRRIGTSAFNSTYNDNTYVGYMTGTTGASTYASTHSNSTDSTIKAVIDDWYKTNIVDTGYSGSVVDAIYCNDRTVVTNDVKYQMFWLDETKTAGNGIGTSDTLYGTLARLESDDDYYNLSEANPTLKCSQVNDRFTIEPAIGTVAGNDKLTYPVGLITADETIFAGGYWAENSTYYLYTGYDYWTMSASYFMNGGAGALGVHFSGSADGGGVVDYSGHGVRPVITLSSSAITGGTGTSTDPFKIS